MEVFIRIEVSVALITLFTEIYDQNHDRDSLKSVIEYSQQAVDLTPDGSPDRAGRLNNLSNHLSTRYEREKKLEDLTQTIKYS